jgi:hypothetical protein
VEQQRAIAQVGNEHRIRHGNLQPDPAADAVVLSVLGVTLTPVVGVLPYLVALVIHVPLPVCAVSCVDGTQDRGDRAGGSGRGPSRVGHTSSACNPALGPWSKANPTDCCGNSTGW